MAGARLRDPGRLRATFLVVMVLLVAVLAGLAWKLLDQDRELATARATERRDGAATVLIAALERKLSGWQQGLGRVLADPNEATAFTDNGALVVSFQEESVEAWPAGALIYAPAWSGVAAPDPQALALAGEAARASAERRVEAALSSYQRLAALGNAQVAGLPAALAARIGRITLHERVADHDAVVREAGLLRDDLAAGRWPIGPDAYHYLRSVADPLLPAPPGALRDSECLAETVAWLWDEWSTGRKTRLPGWDVRESAAGSLLLVWQVIDGQLAATVGPPAFVEATVLADLRALADEQGVQVALAAGDEDLFSTIVSDGPPASRPAAQTGLPWDLEVVAADDDGDLATRRRLLVAGLGVLTMLTLGGAFVVGRSVTRELEAARLKSDFVAAVSHEFRTPLTTLCQLSELLLGDRVASDDDRREYYALLHRESDRLRRLVEGLLTFGRLDAGTADLRFEDVELPELLARWVDEFTRVIDVSRHRFELATDGVVPAVPADADALKSVFWNLFENAVKYSPDGGDVAIHVAGTATGVVVSVRDQGLGIPTAERATVFEPFVRGADARARHIRGSGIGLAIARAIVRAHGGDVTIESDHGRGSTFIVHLPSASDREPHA